MNQIYFNYNLSPNLSIEDFFVGSSNIDAFNVLINNNYEKLLLIGPKKSGKSHLSYIWQERNKAIKFDSNLKEILEKKENILIDDLFEKINEEEIFHIINHSNFYKLKILMTSSINIDEKNLKLKDLTSRLKTFYNVKINLPDDELLINLMIKLFHDKQIIIKNPEIFNFIIKRVNRSYDQIFALVNKIDKFLLQKNKQLTIPIIKELI